MNRRLLKMRTYWKNSDRLILWFAAHYPERVVLSETELESIRNGTLLDCIELWQDSCHDGRTNP